MTPPRREQALQTPARLGYRMPAEWAPHASTWLAWPHDPVTWPGRVPQAEDAYVEIIRALSPHERVDLLAGPDGEAAARRKLGAAGVRNVRFHPIPTVDSWIRDYGPTFVQDAAGALAMVDWRFNAWGDKYEALKADDAVPARLEPLLGVPRFRVEAVMEGGSIDVDGAGSVLTTEQCLLNPNRNPHLTRGEIEGVLRDHLGVDRVLWLGDGIEGDDTDGHVDDIARFVDPQTIVAAVEDDPDDANHAVLAANLKRLRGFRDRQGDPYRVVELPMPGRVETDEGDRLPASYANFYIANQVVLLPVFGHPNDERARRILAPLFPGRTVVPIPCEDLVWGLGTLHCLSQQQPAPRPPNT